MGRATLSSPGGASQVVAFRFRGAVSIETVSEPSEATPRRSTMPLAAWVSTSMPPDPALATILAAGDSGVTFTSTVWPSSVVTAALRPSSEISRLALGPDAVATRLPVASDSDTAGSLDTKLVAPTSTGMSALPGVEIWAMPVGVRANTLVVPGRFSLARSPLASMGSSMR